MARSANVRCRIDLHDAIDVLREQGVITSLMASDFFDANEKREIRFMAEVDVDDVLDDASTGALQAELSTRADYEPFPQFDVRDLADGVRYAVKAEPVLAEAMFARAMPDQDITAISAVLRAS